MPEILIATGHNVTPTVPFDPQPEMPGMVPTRRLLALSGAVIDESSYVPFTWPLIDTEDDYRAILTRCGLLTATTALVSVYIQDQNYDWVYRNGVAVRPQIGTDGAHSDLFLRGFTIIVCDLRVQT